MGLELMADRCSVPAVGASTLEESMVSEACLVRGGFGRTVFASKTAEAQEEAEFLLLTMCRFIFLFPYPVETQGPGHWAGS
jgi:hypothetical protein